MDFRISKGKHMCLYPLSYCLKSIEERFNDQQEIIDSLRTENKYLKEEYDKDEEISKLKARLRYMQERINNSFEITPDERDAIADWKKEHSNLKHGGIHLCGGGTIGGEEYKFIATSIGDVGTYYCPLCGEEFTFREL